MTKRWTWIGIGVVAIATVIVAGIVLGQIGAPKTVAGAMKVGPQRCTDSDPSEKEECARLTTFARQLLDQAPHAPVASVEVAEPRPRVMRLARPGRPGQSVRREARTIASVGPEIFDAGVAHRYEARDEGDLAGYIDYVVKRDRIALIHTEVLPSHQGQGIAEQLVRFALDDARRRGLRVMATCVYVRAYVERHPETHDIVVGMTPV